MVSKDSVSIFLRSSINVTAAAVKPQTLAAFSPDIIPLGQCVVSPQEVVASYDHFVAHAVDPNDAYTLVYLRGKSGAAPDGAASVSAPIPTQRLDLRAVPNELVLWPQVWTKAKIVGAADLSAAKVDEVVAAPHPIKFKTTQNLGRHDTLIVSAEGALPKDCKNWRDLVATVGQDRRTTLYNVTLADNYSTAVSLTSRFRLFEDEKATVKLHFAIETVGTPDSGVYASLFGYGSLPDYTTFSFGRTKMLISPGTDNGVNVDVPKGFDGMITMNVFNEENHVFADHASISLGVYAIDPQGGQQTYVVLGAEHIVFDSNGPVKKLLRKYTPELAEQAAAAAVPSFYFRDTTSDDGVFPRHGYAGHSPDIQPMGQAPVKDVTSTFGGNNYTVDVTDQNHIPVTVGQSNYVYLRPTTTSAAKGGMRLFMLPGAVLQHPSQYNQPQYTVMDYDEQQQSSVAIRSYDVKGSSVPMLMDKPFLVLNNLSAGHYCFIAENKPDGIDPNTGMPYDWPHNEVGEFSTGAEFAAWILSEPNVAWRNVEYSPSPDAPTQTMQTGFTIPPNFSATDLWSFQVRAIKCPPGSQYSMDSDDPKIVLGRQTISSDDQSAGPNFTGVTSGYTAQVALNWYANGKATKTGQRLVGELVLKTYRTGALMAHFRRLFQAGRLNKNFRLFQQQAKEDEFIVGPDYPLLISKPRGKTEEVDIRSLMSALPARVAGDKFKTNLGVLVDITVGWDSLSIKS